MKYIYLIVYFLLIFYRANTLSAQTLYPSLLNVETTINKKIIKGQGLSSLLQVNEGTNEIAILVDIKSISTKNDTLDSLLLKADKAQLFLKGSFPVTNLSFVDNNNEEQREFQGKALLTLNGITRVVNYACTIFNLTGEDEFSLSNMAYPLRINLYFEFEPEDFKLDLLYPRLVNGIKIEISKGLINKLNAGGRSLFTKTQ